MNRDQNEPRLNPITEKLLVHSALDHSTLAHQESEKTGAVTHAIEVDQILVLPMLSEWHSISEAMVPPHAVASAWVLSASNRLCKSRIHDLRVQFGDGNFGEFVVGSSWRIREYHSAIRVGLIRGHLDEATQMNCHESDSRKSSTLTDGAGTGPRNLEENFRHQW